MRLLELEIQNVRGIRNICLKPDGRNLVVWGPNGSGKSAIVDALDFLLTGAITRLTGKGTGDITLRQYGPHIDFKPEQAWVKAKIQLSGTNTPIEVTRHMDHPAEYECDAAYRPLLDPIFKLAKRGQHVLTRREILKYITSEGGARANEIQSLLDIGDVEEVRKTLVRVHHDCSRSLDDAKASLRQTENTIRTTAQLGSYQEDEVLAVVNRQRSIFNQSPIQRLHSSDLKKDLQLPIAAMGKRAVNTTLFESDVNTLNAIFSEERRQYLSQLCSRLVDQISQILQDPKLLKDTTKVDFLSTGLTLIPEDGSCPFCETPFKPGELQQGVQLRLSAAETAARLKQEVDGIAAQIRNELESTLSSVKQVQAVANLVNAEAAMQKLKDWETNISMAIKACDNPLTQSFLSKDYIELIERQLAPQDIQSFLNDLMLEVRNRFPESTPEQTAWDLLTRFEENLKAYEIAKIEVEKSDLYHRRASIMLEQYLIARDHILGKLYGEIQDRFIDLYRMLHEEDEKDFVAAIEPDGAALNFEVDFYGRGKHPPHALHSEGHQDSMGLCLYLALAERLTGGILDLLILDDVVMSVDSDHRRKLCRLLAKSFSHRQFLITTHDRTWSNQLRTEGVVRSQEVIEFYNWNLDTGPRVNCGKDLWSRIDENMAEGNIAEAAALLRRSSEDYFAQVCEALRARVVFKQSGGYELGELLSPAMGQLKYLLKTAKSAANSWKRLDVVENLNVIDSTVSQVFTRTNAEQWAINTNVHYNEWANFSRDDFQPVVDAFRDLFGLFFCPNCGGMYHVVMEGATFSSVQCNCGMTHWNLLSSKTESQNA
ncbi:MAG: AAA family ATPase [Anaerolineaceae bacterium]|nr:AAA family ATPase [Anaerolineaceae bacterium]